MSPCDSAGMSKICLEFLNWMRTWAYTSIVVPCSKAGICTVDFMNIICNWKYCLIFSGPLSGYQVSLFMSSCDSCAQIPAVFLLHLTGMVPLLNLIITELSYSILLSCTSVLTTCQLSPLVSVLVVLMNMVTPALMIANLSIFVLTDN